MITRRIFVAAAGAAVLPGFLSRAAAETAPKAIRLGWITVGRLQGTAAFVDALKSGLTDLGYVEGQHFTLDARYADDDGSRVPPLVEELIGRPIDILVAQGSAVFTISRMTLPVPVVYGYSGDPIAAGFADSLAKPLRNMTGQTLMAVELNGKRLELLREMLPDLRRVAILANPMHPGEDLERANSQEMAHQLGMTIQYWPTRTREDLESAFAGMGRDSPEAIIVFPDGFAVQNRQAIVDFATRQRIPVISAWAVMAQSGALCTYGPRLNVSYRRLAYYIDRIAKGTPAAELPIERPTQFELVINLKTAKALALTVPPSVLARADEVIE